MWFKQLSDHAPLADPLVEVRQLLQRHYEKSGRALSAPIYSNLHSGYFMTLDEIGAKAKFPNEPKSLRLVESDSNGPIALHELSLDKDKPRLLATFVDPRYTSNFDQAILKIKSHVKDETKGEIRHLSVPALNVEAVWLHFDEEKHDRFALTRNFNAKDSGKLHNGHDFLALLEKLKNKLGKIDEEMGA